jgi:hypothetical protein
VALALTVGTWSAMRSLPNNALERTNAQRGRAVLAMDRVLGGAELAPCIAAQLDR